MYPLTCPGGYSVPLKTGQYEIVGVRATVNDTTALSQIVLYDDGGIISNTGRILPTSFDPGSSGKKKTVLVCNVKGIANLDANLEVLFPEPIKTRYGLSISASTNIVAGSLQVYCR